VVHLDKMQETHGSKGLKVLAITNEGRSVVDGFVAKTGAKHGIVIEAGDSADTFQIKGYPTSYLIGPDGKILAAGHPSEDQIVKALELVRIPPELPKALASVQAPLKKEKWAEARAKAQALIDGGTLTNDEDKQAAEGFVKWIDWLAQGGLDTAKQEGEKGRWYEATVALEEVKKAFKGLPHAVEAEAQLKAILADKAKKDEVTAYQRFLKAKQTQRDKELKPKEALPLFKAIVSKYENTRAGKAAAEIVKRLELDAGK
jgi:hypothetical protein